MKLRHALHVLTVCVSLLPALQAYGRGGETGTLDQDPAATVGTAALDRARSPTRSWSPYYLGHDQFRRLRGRLSVQPMAPIPGWDSQRAFRSQDRYFTEDNVYEIFPILRESVR